MSMQCNIQVFSWTNLMWGRVQGEKYIFFNFTIVIAYLRNLFHSYFTHKVIVDAKEMFMYLQFPFLWKARSMAKISSYVFYCNHIFNKPFFSNFAWTFIVDGPEIFILGWVSHEGQAPVANIFFFIITTYLITRFSSDFAHEFNVN